MTRLASAFVAATASRVLVAGLSLVALPIYYKLLGAENFGVIGFFLSLQVMVGFLDLGLGATLIRKFSQTHAQEAVLIRRYALTFETFYVFIALAMAIILIASSTWLSHSWIQASDQVLLKLPDQLKIASLCICCVWFSSIYNSMLIGLEQQFQLSIAHAFLAVLRFCAPILAVIWFADLTVFFLANLLIAVSQVLILKLLAKSFLPQVSEAVRVDFKLIRLDSGFSMGMFGIFLTTFLIAQTDKIILSKLLNLSQFGIYTLCATLAGGIYLAVQPLFNVLLPRFNRLISENSQDELQSLYGLGAQMMALIVMPASTLIFFFSEEVLMIWTMQTEVVSQGAWLLKFLVLANTINALMNLPYCLQIAAGWTSLPLKVNYVIIFSLLPAMVWAAQEKGALGAAWVTLFLHACIMCTIPHIMHMKLLIRSKWQWYLRAILLPAACCGLIFALANQFWPVFENRWTGLFALVVLLLLSTLVTLVSLIDLRRFVWQFLVMKYCSKF
jgi:O-antigen/teichoic acid export membrane protein